MGCGMPEYLLILRKLPTDTSNGYADEPVVKSKDEYSRARWQFDAHGHWRSSGNRALTIEDLDGITRDRMFQSLKDVSRAFSGHSLGNVYDNERDVELAEHLDKQSLLPPSFMLLQPHTEHPAVWTDVARMLSANSLLSARKKEMHLCPLPFDIVDRCINRFTNPGDVVYDPFGGVGTVAFRAVKAGRQGLGCELNPEYFSEAVHFCRQMEDGAAAPSLFEFLDAVEEVSV